MLERRITPSEVRAVVDAGEIIEEDGGDRPYPSFVLLGACAGKALHVVLGYDAATENGYVVTTYVPDLAYWKSDWKTRKSR